MVEAFAFAIAFVLIIIGVAQVVHELYFRSNDEDEDE